MEFTLLKSTAKRSLTVSACCDTLKFVIGKKCQNSKSQHIIYPSVMIRVGEYRDKTTGGSGQFL